MWDRMWVPTQAGKTVVLSVDLKAVWDGLKVEKWVQKKADVMVGNLADPMVVMLARLVEKWAVWKAAKKGAWLVAKLVVLWVAKLGKHKLWVEVYELENLTVVYLAASLEDACRWAHS